MRKVDTSWESVGEWYKGSVGREGHSYHREVVLPNLLRLLETFSAEDRSLLDLACGQGVLSRQIRSTVRYVGVDIAPSLIAYATQNNRRRNHRFVVGDITSGSLAIEPPLFDCATIVLAIQNIEHPLSVFQNASRFLKGEGRLFLVMNHPCFRIPRQSCWQVDERKKLQFRRIESYMSSRKIPIQMHPSQAQNSPVTLSFHYPLSQYIEWLQQAGFFIQTMEEWCSTKQSSGKMAKMENRSRNEFPLFLALVAGKHSN